MADSLAEALGVGAAGAEQRFKIGGGGYGGGGGASVGTIDDLETGDKVGPSNGSSVSFRGVFAFTPERGSAHARVLVNQTSLRVSRSSRLFV